MSRKNSFDRALREVGILGIIDRIGVGNRNMKVQVSRSKQVRFSGDLFGFVVSHDDIKGLKEGKPGELPVDLFGGAKRLSSLFQQRNFQGKGGQLLSVVHSNGSPLVPSTVLFMGFESKKKERFYELQAYRKMGSSLFQQAKVVKAERVGFSFGVAAPKDEEAAIAFLEGIHLTNYSFDYYKARSKEKRYLGISELQIFSQEAFSTKVIDETAILCDATKFARDLVNLSPRDCTPGTLVTKAKEVAKEGKLTLQVHNKASLIKLKAFSLLAVAQGSDQPPYLIKLVYKPAVKSAKVIALVGKGVTFDSGGLSIKPAQSMEDMKGDMAGAAAVLGAMKAIARLKPNVEVRAYIPTVENMINGQATRPGDVVRAMNGKTIEILNTDAEGRLILADAVHLAEKEGAEAIVDVATLTGAILVALGLDYAGLFTDDDKIASAMITEGDKAGEHFWRMPLPEEYKDLLKSKTAELKNIGGRYGGSITGALFIKEFVDKARWAHLDVAGTAYSESEKGHVKFGGTGFGVRTLARAVSKF
jgi:leucyl aminopeptidase